LLGFVTFCVHSSSKIQQGDKGTAKLDAEISIFCALSRNRQSCHVDLVMIFTAPSMTFLTTTGSMKYLSSSTHIHALLLMYFVFKLFPLCSFYILVLIQNKVIVS